MVLRRTAGALFASTATLAALGMAGSSEATGPKTLDLRRSPYLGVRCAKPNSIRCDRVGLAVWLEKPATRLRASVDGHRVAMRVPTGFVPTSYLGRRGMYWEGSLQPAGLEHGSLKVRADRRGKWYGVPPVEATVRVTARFSDGSAATTRVRVSLRPGWG